MKFIICSIDKDLDTIPGSHYNWDHGEHYDITEEQAHYNHMYQTLVGDSTDNYRGLPSVGPVKAKEILAKAKGSLWEAVVAAYEKKGLTEADALIQAQVSQILIADNYKNGKVIPWAPC